MFEYPRRLAFVSLIFTGALTSIACSPPEVSRFYFVRCNTDPITDTYVAFQVRAEEQRAQRDAPYSSISFQRDGLLLRVPPMWWAAEYTAVTALSFAATASDLGTMKLDVATESGSTVLYEVRDVEQQCWEAAIGAAQRWGIALPVQ